MLWLSRLLDFGIAIADRLAARGQKPLPRVKRKPLAPRPCNHPVRVNGTCSTCGKAVR